MKMHVFINMISGVRKHQDTGSNINEYPDMEVIFL